MRVLVWSTATETLSVDEDALNEFQALENAKLRVVGILNGDATADTAFDATKEHQLMLHTMSTRLRTQPAPQEQGKRPLLWMHVEPSSNVVVLHSNNEQAGRLLLVLLSSVVLYSQDSELNFDKLKWMSALPTQMKIRGNQDEAGVAKDLGQHMPRFVWVARNAKVKWLKDAATGATLTPLEYFNYLLALDSGFSEASMQANAFKTYFTSFFPHRDTVHLSRAVDINSGIELAWNTPAETLRPPYVAALEKLYNKYLSPNAGEDTVPVKTLQGTPLNLSQFDQLLEYFVEVLNNHQLPILANATSKLVQATIEAGVAKASAAYTETFASLVPSGDSTKPVSSRSLLLAHLKSISAASLAIFVLTEQVPSTSAAVLADKVKTIHAQIDASYISVAVSQAELSKAKCEEVLSSLHPVAFSSATAELERRSREEFSDGLHSILLGIKNSLQGSLSDYRGKAEAKQNVDVDDGLGSAMYPSLVSYLSSEILNSVIAWGADVLALFEKHMKQGETERDELEAAYEVALASDVSGGFDAGDSRKVFEDELAARTDQLAAMKSSLTAELEDKRTELERLLLDLRGMQSKHDARIASTESEIQRIKAKTADTEAQAQAERLRREQLAQGAASEILNLESNFHAEQKNLYNEQRELLSKVVELERALMGKKTAHLQTLFDMETNCTKAVEETRSNHKKELQKLKTQAKQDITMLKKAYDSKKVVVQQQLDEVNALIKQCEEQLNTLEPKINITAPTPQVTGSGAISSTPSLAKPVSSPSRAARQDEMCKQS
ncbi:hypothetical protein AC1031_003750 [Aphanomyces cochlioides]|nr:hypothetical protein AC1031_003750 [Aphanomyces cochlioides]